MRGHWLRLTDAWRELRAHHRLPAAVRELLGQAVAAAVLLAATLKFRGTLTFQLQGNGAVNLLVAQCTHDFRLRAVARCDAALLPSAGRGAADFRSLVGSDGRVTVTVEAEERSLRYQGVVPLSRQLARRVARDLFRLLRAAADPGAARRRRPAGRGSPGAEASRGCGR